jgi:hypothetical protein
MSIKRSIETGSSSPLSKKNDSFKEATRSLRPKTFQRTHDKADAWDEEQQYFMSMLMGKSGAGFRDVDSFAQQSKYHQYVFIMSLS